MKKKTLDHELRKQCYDCSLVWGIIGKCKKHSPIHTLNHMSLHKWSYWWIVKIGRIIVGTVMPVLIKIMVVVAFAVLFAYVLNIGLQKQELVTCQKLKSQSQTYTPLFYLTQAEKAMCDAHGVSIDAPVK